MFIWLIWVLHLLSKWCCLPHHLQWFPNAGHKLLPFLCDHEFPHGKRFLLLSVFFNLIYLYCIYCYIYQIFVSNKDLFGCFLLLALPVYLITQLLLQQLMLLNFVNLSHLLKLFFGDGLNDNEKLFILYFTINIDKITSVWFLFHSGNKLIIWFVFSLFSLRKINYFKNWIYSWFPLIWKFSFYFIVINLNTA